MMIAGAVEIHDKAPGRLRLKVINDYSARTLGAFVDATLEPGSIAISDGWSGYARLKDVKHQPKVVGPMAAHVLLFWIHRVFGNAKRWASIMDFANPICSAIWTNSSFASIGGERHKPPPPRSSASPSTATMLHTKC